MALGDILSSVNSAVPSELAGQLNKITIWIQAIGIAALIWVVIKIFSIVSTIINRKKLNQIEEKLTNIDTKVDKILKIRKR